MVFTAGCCNMLIQEFDLPRLARMKARSWILIVFLLHSGTVFALSKSEVRAIIEAAYPGARITEIEKETYKGEKIYEVDFKHGGENLEAIISLEGEIVKVQIDD